MKYPVLPSLTLAAIAIVVVSLMPAPAVAQSSTAAVKNWAVPRTPWGDPDLQGTWTSDDVINVPMQRAAELGERRFLTEEEFAARAKRDEEAKLRALDETTPGPATGVGPPGHWLERGRSTTRLTSLVVDPPDGRIPAQTQEAQERAAALQQARRGRGPADSYEDRSMYDRCITRGVTGSIFPVIYGNGSQIVQAPGYVAIRYEMIHETRVIPLDNRPHLGQSLRQYMGDARGRWEGNTLVVETTNLTDRTGLGLNGGGARHSEAIRLVERFTRVDANTIDYEVTIDDPKTYARAWRVAFPLKQEPDYEVFEYACHEGNKAMPNILSGARADERAAANGAR